MKTGAKIMLYWKLPMADNLIHVQNVYVLVASFRCNEVFILLR